MDIMLAVLGGVLISECCRWYWRNDFFGIRWELCEKAREIKLAVMKYLQSWLKGQINAD